MTEETARYVAEHLLSLYRITEMDEGITEQELSWAIQQAAEECGE